ncbi:hypothetical protein SHIRM173S_07491 [Streptomyces hirsutus]
MPPAAARRPRSGSPRSGAAAPHEETLDTGLAYASRVYRGPKGVLDGATVGYYVYPGPSQLHGGGALPLEDGTHLVIVSGLRGDAPPTDDDEFVTYAKRLGHPLLDRWMDEAEPLSPPFGYRRTANVRRRYDLPGPPAGFARPAPTSKEPPGPGGTRG